MPRESEFPFPGSLISTFLVTVKYTGTSLIRNRTPPEGPNRALGIVLVLGPRGRRFLMGELPLYEGFVPRQVRGAV